jgi:Tol biopolymer transport system component
VSAIQPGTRLGPHEITAKLGEGGMGEVYRATDTKLDRQVAVKVLPAEFTEDEERLARFEREAKLLAQLHHPNIASIFGLEESGGTRALVMELVEGPTLAERLEAGPFPFDESLSVSLQIAHALEEAHEKGIVHRDLKPQNIKASMEGKVKVLDFGLAKAMDPAADSAVSAADLARSPTLMQSPTLTAAHGTQLGVILGTAAYMSPEQARGGAVDHRADIWAFGVVLWEMLTGASMFAADTVSDTLAGVLRAEIDLERLPADTPPAIRRLLRRCLERNPKNRLHSIADARIVIEEVLAGKSDLQPATVAIPAPAAEVAPAWRRALPWALAAIGLAAAAVTFVATRSSPPVAVLHADLGAPNETHFLFQGDYGAPVALSPDGTQVVFGALGDDAKSRLWVRSLATGAERRLDATAGGFAPFFSPDGRSVGYFTDGKLLVVSLAGGAPQKLADAPFGRGGAWAPDGTIIFSPDFRAPLYRVRAAGGRPEPLTRVDASRHSTHRWPVLTPDGRAVVYLALNHDQTKQAESELRWVRLDGGDDRAVVPSLSNGVPAGDRLLYVRQQTLVAQSFDPGRGEVSGDPAVVASEVLYDPATWRATFAAVTHRLLYSPAGAATGSHLSRVDRSGRLLEELAPDDVYFDLFLSPDGKRLLVARGQPADLWLLDLERRTFGRFTFEAGDEFSAVWSRDGRWAYYVSVGYEDRRDRLFRKPIGGDGAAELLWEADDPIDIYPLDVTADGRRLLLTTGTWPFVRESDLATLELGPTPRLVPLVATPATEGEGRLSPDGRWLAYQSNESGVPQIYVRSFPGDGASAARWQVSIDGGIRALWSSDGGELVYLEPSLNLSRVAVAADGAGGLRFGAPEALFATTLLADQRSFAIAPDGQSFILNHYGEAQSRPLRLVENWRALLAR